jgi:hypothetical protein
MATVLDHLFILCDAGAPEAAALTRLGLEEGPPNRHPGQGTACRRFFFPRHYIELLWVENQEEARSDATARTRLWDRWSARPQGGCPFGLVFVSDAGRSALPFSTWSYAPAYLPEGVTIEIAVDTPLDEPEFFVLPAVTRSSSMPRPEQAALPGSTITGLRLPSPAGRPTSAAARWAESTGLLTFEASDAYSLEVTFDHAGAGHLADARPGLPLVLRW